MLSAHLGISRRILYVQLKGMLSDKDIRKKFGKYNGKCFNPKQLRIIEEELGYEIT